MILEVNEAETVYRATLAKAHTRTATIPAVVDEEGNEIQQEETVEVPAAPPVIPNKCTVKTLIARFNQSNAQLDILTVQTRRTAFATYSGEQSPYNNTNTN
ncbi:hypothetical protein CC80DRAFT_541402 [Byssothecium circinans]|uniref:Uncharacterized protein n=1 Tax=Byssothecium circinans TaxID=147558 RepID=A0A6A5UGL6_9PLEO|nr:hypothetical protein CC80DRAFT_541402 [Byssothecium circinans]